MAGLTYASNGLDNSKHNFITKLSKIQGGNEFSFKGICKGNAVVVNWAGQLEYVNMGKPDEDIITDDAIGCAELYGQFVKNLALIYPKVVTSAQTYTEL